MKKLLIFLFTITIFYSCAPCGRNQEEVKESRVKVKEIVLIDGTEYVIVEVNYKEYLTSSRGGFIKISE